MNKSKLSLVREALLLREDVQVVGVIPMNECLDWIFGTPNGWTQTFDFFVGLRETCIDPDGLQEILYGLVPNLPYTQEDRFRRFDGGNLDLGKLYYDEVIGEEVVTRSAKIGDEEILEVLRKGHPILTVEGAAIQTHTYKMQRRTWVRLFPNVEMAKAALETGENSYHIPKKLLTGAAPLPVARPSAMGSSDKRARRWSLRRLFGR